MSRTPPQAPSLRQSGQARPTTSEVAESIVPGRTVSGVYSQGQGVSTSRGSIRKRKSLDDGNVTEVELSSGPSPSSQLTPEAKKRISQESPKTPRQKRITVVLPNSTRSLIRLPCEAKAPSLESFLLHLQREVETEADPTISNGRMVQWGKNVWLKDVRGKKIADDEMLQETLRPQLVTIILEDGHSASKHCVEWNITPEPHMLGRLPQGYNMETALADEVDNALQAVWGVVNQKRLVSNHQKLMSVFGGVNSVDIQPEKISIFDTGLGMDGHNITNWGTVGSSTHRQVNRQAVGGSPPYLKPYLGKYGAGGVAAALHLGSMVTVSSKTKESSKVVTLVMDKEELERRQRSNDPDQSKEWQTGGEFRDMTAEEKEKAPDGSFTLVEITQLKRQYSVPKEISKVRRILADIYFLYIHSDEFGVSNRRLKYPIEFEVNEENLAEVQECETAISNQHTCRGDPFTITLGFAGVLQDPKAGGRSRSQNKDTAHAEIKCYYYPNLKGKEELDTVLEKLAKLGLTTQSFEDVPRVIVRWLGRLLPENKWGLLPFMRVPAKRLAMGWKKHWEKRVRATIAVDAGFCPTQSKTQLERDEPFTVALEKFGDPEDAKKSSAADVEVTIKVKGKAMNTAQVADEYMRWLRTMHETFDEEVEFLDESPTYIVDQPPFEILGLNKDHTQLAIVFYKHMRDGTGEWNAGESGRPLRVKLQRGATGVNKDLYATIEWFYCQGTGEEHGEVRMVCRPIDVLVEDGSKIKTTTRGRVTFALNKSQCFSVALLNTPKCQRLSNDEWAKKEEENAKKAPSFIEVLNEDDSKALHCDKTLPYEMRAGSKLPQFLAVVRPKQGTGASFKQGMIYGKALEMQLRVTFTEKFATVPKERSKDPTASRSGADILPSGQLIWEGTVKGDHTEIGVKGLYLFDTNKMGLAEKLVKQGIYYFNFELVSPSDNPVKPLERKVRVQASMQTKCWTVCTHKGKCEDIHPNISVCLNTRLMEPSTEELHLSKLDGFSNPQLILKLPTLRVTIVAPDGSTILSGTVFNPTDMAISSDKHYLTLRKKVMFNEGDLRLIAPSHEARLAFEIKDGKATDKLFSVNSHVAELKCRVFPGWITSVLVETSPPLDFKVPCSLKEPVRPTDVIEVLTFQGKDSFGNIAEKGQKVEILLDGLSFEDKNGAIREVDEQGLLKLGGLLKVTGLYNSTGSITIRTLERKGKKKGTLLELSFKVASCSLRLASLVENTYLVGRSLEGVIVEVLDYKGVVDTTIDGPYHTLTLNWMKNITVPIVKGRSELPKILLPATAGPWLGKIVHTTHKNLKLDLQLNLELEMACRIDLPTQDQILSARCDEVISLKFLAHDGRGMPAQLTAKMCENIVLNIEHDAYASGECTVNCLEIIESNPSLTSYEARVQLGGTTGEYKVVAVDPSRTLQQHHGSTAILTWRVRLDSGKLERLAAVVMTGELSRTSCNLVSLLATCEKSITVAECATFPPVHVYLLDAYENLCGYHDTQVLDLVLVTKGGKHSRQMRTTCSSCQIDKSRGEFEPFKLEAGVGSYKIVISTCNMSFKPGTHGPKEPEFILEVTPGNHPSALHFLEKSPIVFTITPKTQVLPPLAIIVDCADNQPLQSLVSPLMVIHHETPDSPSIATYKGELSESEEMSAEFRPSSLFIFSRIYVPSQAGTYTLEVSLPEHDIATVSRQLVVRHGVPAEVELCVVQSGQKSPVLLAKLLDAHCNVCIENSGLILNLELSVSEDQEEPLSTQGIERSCLLLSEDFAVVESGIASFAEIQLSPGRLGAYTLTVAVEEDQKQLESWPPLKPAELQMMVTSSTVTQKFQENIKAVGDAVKDLKDKLIPLKREMSMGKQDIKHHQGELNNLLRKRNTLPTKVVNANDDEILVQATMQRTRTNEEVMLDLRRRAEIGRGSALAFLEACSGDKFLSPHARGPLAGEGIGLPVTLARVESQALNQILSKYMGTESLLLIVCKTQQGINSLEVKVNGIIDTRFGLASVSRYPLKEDFPVLDLSDIIRAWTGPIDESHPQRLLVIDPPRIMVDGERRIPPGFLAYAVNLLHIRDEHLRMRFSLKNFPNRSFGLRESLFYSELQSLQVYDTRVNLLHAKEEKAIRFAAISLDGSMFKGTKQRLGLTAVTFPVSFALVSVEERLATCGLLQPVAGAIERKKRQLSAFSTSQVLEQQIRECTEACMQREKESERICEEVNVLEKTLQGAQSQEKNSLELLAHRQRQADATSRTPVELCFSFLGDTIKALTPMNSAAEAS